MSNTVLFVSEEEKMPVLVSNFLPHLLQLSVVKKGLLCWMKCFKNDSKDFISNIKETVGVTLATDYNKRLKTNKKSLPYQ